MGGVDRDQKHGQKREGRGWRLAGSAPERETGLDESGARWLSWFMSPGEFGSVWRHCELSQLGRGVVVKARGAAKCPTVRRTVPPTPTPDREWSSPRLSGPGLGELSKREARERFPQQQPR